MLSPIKKLRGSEITPRLPLPPADFIDPVIEVYKNDVDRTLLRENLKLTVQERLEKLMGFMDFLGELREHSRGRTTHESRSPNCRHCWTNNGKTDRADSTVSSPTLRLTRLTVALGCFILDKTRAISPLLMKTLAAITENVAFNRERGCAPAFIAIGIIKREHRP